MPTDLETATITTGDLCRLLDLTPARVSQLKSAGIVTKRGRSSYALLESVMGYVRFLRGTGEGAGLDFREMRARLVKLQGDKLEAELALLKGRTILITAAVEPLATECGIIRQRLLSVPSKMAPLVVGRDIGEAAAILRREIVDVLTELSCDAALKLKASETEDEDA